ncbi:unnamed protein product [Miscanthus lutarioriparius]|uniref:DUF7032 domain-containing protein n=1 Tax=Miscanthus lutarioriparius TaxID=422564 RepID=A0A811S539_9POAL|nr:unnamed protein product [Miscanthus lutarioriparius]
MGEAEEAPGVSNGESLELLMSMASSSLACCVSQFPAKWQSIKDKLHQLCCSLNSLCSGVGGDGDGNDDDEEHPVLAELLRLASATVKCIQVVASQCSDGSYKGGRLRLRSDLDNLSCKLDAHMKQLKEMASSGVPSPSKAIVAVRPSAEASVGEKAFYLKDLFSRIRIGGTVQRSQALATIRELLAEDEFCAKVVALDVDDGIALLTGFLESTDACIQEEAAGAVAVVASSECYRGMLVKAGVIAQLVQLLENADTASELGKERAAHALRELTENSDNQQQAHQLVFAVLRNLSRVEEVKMFMVEQGVVTELVKLSQKKEELIYPDLPYSYKAREVALAAIWFFCFSSANSLDDLISSDVLGWLLFYLNNGDYAVLECTLKILRHLSEVSEEYNRMMGRAGYLSALSSLLGAKSCRVREMAAQVLSSLLMLHPNRVIFIQDGDNLNRLLQLLDPAEGKLMEKDLILSAIMSLAETHSGRKKIVTSENFCCLKELADSGDFDAKKIVRKLSNNRLQTIFSKIWSV